MSWRLIAINDGAPKCTRLATSRFRNLGNTGNFGSPERPDLRSGYPDPKILVPKSGIPDPKIPDLRSRIPGITFPDFSG